MRERPTSVPRDAEWSEVDQEWIAGPRDGRGRWSGRIRYWRPDGTLACEATLVAGVPHGPGRRFHESGEVSQANAYLDGAPHGTTVSYRAARPRPGSTERQFADLPEPVVRYEADYEHGLLRTIRYFDASGRRLARTGEPLPERPPAVPDTALWTAGREWADARFGPDGDPVGALRVWDAAGVPRRERVHGGGTVTTTVYHETGGPRLSYVERDGRLDGLARSWRPDGTPRWSAELRDGAYHGPVREHDDAGRVRDVPTGSPAAPPPVPPAPPAPDAALLDLLADPPDGADPVPAGRTLSPVAMAYAIVRGWLDERRPPLSARHHRRLVRGSAGPALAARLAELGLDRAPRVYTTARLRTVVATLRAEPQVDTAALVAAAATAGPVGYPLALEQPAGARAALSRRVCGHRLRLSRAGLERVPEAIGELPELREVDLSHNGLRELPDAFGRLFRLEELDLSGNRLRHLPAALAGLPLLRSLQLAGNGLTALPDVVPALDQLEVLGLGDNQLAELPDVFDRLPRLRWLWLNDNPLSGLPPSLGRLRGLEFLHLGGTAMAEPPPYLFEMGSLEELWFGSPPVIIAPPTSLERRGQRTDHGRGPSAAAGP